MRFVFVVILVMSSCAQGQLKTGFYSSLCPRAEAIVRSTVEAHSNKDPTILAGLLRLHFHDCFVQVSFILFFYAWLFVVVDLLFDMFRKY